MEENKADLIVEDSKTAPESVETAESASSSAEAAENEKTAAEKPAEDPQENKEVSAEKQETPKKSKLKKILRITLKTLGIFLLVLVIAVGILFWQLDNIVAAGIRTFGTQTVGTDVNVKAVSIKPFSGLVQIENLTVDNPEGFLKEHIFSMDNFVVDVDIWSVTKNEIIVEYLEISGLTIDVEYSMDKGLNLNVLLDNIKKKSGKDAAEAQPAQEQAQQSAQEPEKPAAEAKPAQQPEKPAAEAKPAREAAQQTAQQPEKPTEAAQQTAQQPAPAQKKVTIRKMVLKDIKFTFSSKTLNVSVPLPLPDLILEDLASNQTPGEIATIVIEKLLDNIWVALAENNFTKELKALGEDIVNQAVDSLKESGKEFEEEVKNFVDEAQKEIKKELNDFVEKGKEDLKNSLQDLFPSRNKNKDKK